MYGRLYDELLFNFWMIFKLGDSDLLKTHDVTWRWQLVATLLYHLSRAIMKKSSTSIWIIQQNCVQLYCKVFNSAMNMKEIPFHFLLLRFIQIHANNPSLSSSKHHSKASRFLFSLNQFQWAVKWATKWLNSVNWRRMMCKKILFTAKKPLHAFL